MDLSENQPFLMIGSMKSGTTSVFADMIRHSKIFSPTIKEPADLCYDDVLDSSGRAKYFRVFSGASPGQWIGEATTFYTQFPSYGDVPRRALAVFGANLRLIFIGRDPFERMKSHYRHEVQKGNINGNLLSAIDSNPELKTVSNYDLQLEKWLSVFPREQLLVLRMEDYQRDPMHLIHRIWKFLDISPEPMSHGVTANVSAGKRAPRGLIRKVVRSRVYGLYFKRWLPQHLRRSLRAMLVPRRATSFQDAMPKEVESSLRHELMESCRNFYAMAQEDITL